MTSLWAIFTNLSPVDVLDIPRIYTGLAEWLACMVFAMPLKKRLGKGYYVLVSVVCLAIQCLFLELTGDLPVVVWIPCMMVAVCGMLVLLLLLCDADAMVLAYTCLRAFIVAEFTASLEWELHCFLWPQDNFVWWQRYGLLVLVYGAIYLLAALLESKLHDRQRSFAVRGNDLLTVIIMALAVFAISNLSFYYGGTPFSGHYGGEVLNVRTLVDAAGVALLYAYHFQLGETQARQELVAMHTLLESQYAQYRMSRESIDMVNRKYHDLKHQIAALRAEKDSAVRNQWLDEMEEEIRNYEAQNKTGNSVLDTVLTGKSLYCQKHGIALTVVADGEPLGFMNVMDICTIFGNALDNAIECERKIADRSRRMIHLTLTTQKQFLLLQVENYCPDMPELRDGLPLTTKADAENHGFGLKSIRYTARKYGGSTTISAEDGWFVLKVLLPLPREAPQSSRSGLLKAAVQYGTSETELP